ncbi:hypothetical protein HBI56_047690 [Parastagonospora nodorum]|uniref:Uncharacterized protein n=2 Tax=Phaeosphaeria nodorum (strain SN15 / ATCC MYA-4574 / FGSC 10173) TaxID=321614 RepID=A0A7U2HV71_PHANO|nr:hypothetical protein SNOG_02084 [Parastagonospora nodorum SN15]KAH3916586.1 hypothetical protein HBH56_060630 [Parastagonospora nodorum]EAT90296.2 hypothetical protein SNOG_02084 [Parastagonospora nodorum SN15]KAH3930938.1 hypothetical protein HBH54_104560 [Parastagonospora nodorum]KAH3968184.1 hypothetical protein HBH51_134240 [Parastagonospora nodorum]KAH4074130.1 hypothetical protein HBH50_042940 [Parastagonospora nodorum]
MVSAVVRSSLLTHNNTQHTQELVQAIIDRAHLLSQADHEAKKASRNMKRARKYESIRVLVATDTMDESAPQYSASATTRGCMARSPYQEEVLEAGSELDVARQYWHALGFEPTGMLTQLHCKDAQVQVETKKRGVKRRRGG